MNLLLVGLVSTRILVLIYDSARTPSPVSESGSIALEANAMLRNEMPIFDVCRPCSVRYDFVAKFETLDYDMDYFFKKFNFPIKFPSKIPTTNPDYMRLYYHGVKVEHLQILQALYYKDFQVS